MGKCEMEHGENSKATYPVPRHVDDLERHVCSWAWWILGCLTDWAELLGVDVVLIGDNARYAAGPFCRMFV